MEVFEIAETEVQQPSQTVKQPKMVDSQMLTATSPRQAPEDVARMTVLFLAGCRIGTCN